VNKEKLTPAEGDTSAPEPKQESISEPSSGDETPDSQAGGDTSEDKGRVPQARFSEVARERTKLKEQNAELRNELRRKQVELAISECYEKPSALDPLHRRMFLEMVLDWDSCFDPDGVLVPEILIQALGEFSENHLDGQPASQLCGSGGAPYRGDSDPWYRGESKGRDPYKTRNSDNREFLSKAYAKKDD